jgi:hypothetical protein
MTYMFILAAAAVVCFWPQLAVEFVKLRANAKVIEPRYMLAAAMAAGCLVAVGLEHFGQDQQPIPPAPPAPLLFTLKGKFIGPTASQDAAMLGALCDELANCLDYDSSQAEPRIKTGAAIEDLRLAAREARLRGVSLGARQPHARDAVKLYLDQAAGTSGGPLTAEQRVAWVSAFRDVGRAATDASR